MRREQRNVESKNDHTTYLKQNESSQYNAQYQYVSYRVNSIFFFSMIIINGEERDHKEQPYSERQYVLIRKHLMKGSSAENLHKTELAFLFML